MTLAPPQPGRAGGPLRAVAGLFGAGAVVSALGLAGAPWWAVTLAAFLALVMTAVLGLAQILMPQESEHKRDLWLEVLRRHKPRPSGPRSRRRLPTARSRRRAGPRTR
ncbi:hypothetical protein [Streptomyces sp. NPDC007205]|uniref:hypothetical protein n=1 Tax=Streptomyces sp. NPDC007205 TaxID=3154316 RepID=UPI0033D2E7A5